VPGTNPQRAPRLKNACTAAGPNASIGGLSPWCAAFKPNAPAATLITSVAKFVTPFRELKTMLTQEKPMTSATLTLGGRMRTATTLAAVAACLTIGALGTARADNQSITVKYSEHDLLTEQGSLALYRRISTAAHLVCDADDLRDLSRVAAARACREEAIAKAVQTVNSPQLAAVYAARRWHS
jgi:UrcA family protein